MARPNDSRVLVVGSIAVILGTVGCSPTKTEYSAAFNVKTTMGQQVRIKRYAEWNIFCAPRIPTIVVRTSPVHGTLFIRQESGPAGVTRVGATDCRGKVVPVVAVYYTPESGFRGSEQIEYSVGYSGGALRDIATIDVK